MEENQTMQPAQTPPPAPSEPKVEKKFSFRKWPILVIGLLFLIILLMGGYIFMSSGKTAQEKKPTSDNIELTKLTDTPSPTAAEMKTFTSAKFADLSFKGYTLEYPSDWTLKEERSETPTPISTVTLTKGTYSLKIFQAATGGAMCIYEGDMPEGPASDYRTSKFTDIESFASLRQTESPANGKMAYVYCQKNTTDASYGQPTSVGHMSVTTGVASADPAILTEIETIVKSIKTL